MHRLTNNRISQSPLFEPANLITSRATPFEHAEGGQRASPAHRHREDFVRERLYADLAIAQVALSALCLLALGCHVFAAPFGPGSNMLPIGQSAEYRALSWSTLVSGFVIILHVGGGAGNLRTVDNGGPYDLTALNTQAAHVKGVVTADSILSGLFKLLFLDTDY